MIVATRSRRSWSAVLVGWTLAGAAGCTIDSDATLDFTNQTDETVWVAHNPDGPNGFGVPDRMWISAEPDTPVVINDGGCIETGELVVATEPAESAIIDIRPLAEANAEICPGDDWEWSGVGDHD